MSGLIGWFARNTVAANLLMVLLLIGGIYSYFSGTIRREQFPTLTARNLSVAVTYRGATPEEVENSICIKIEESLDGVEDIKRMTSRSSEGMGVVSIEIEDGADLREVLDDVKTQVDAIDTFPEDADEPLINEQKIEEPVIAVAVSGATDPVSLRKLADQVRDDLLGLEEVTKVEREGAPPYEFSIEIREETLRRFQLTFDDVARAVKRYSLNLPAGSVKSVDGEILFRSDAQAYSAREFEDIPIRTQADGSRVYIRDVADVQHGFEDTGQVSLFDGDPSIVLQVFRIGDQHTTVIADAVYEYVEAVQSRLPQGMSVSIWDDRAVMLEGRLELLQRNGRLGLLLVFVVLALFLRAKLAFWVGVGLSTAILGAIWVLPMLDQSINFLSTFGFIMVLGILVDDAIIVAENIAVHRTLKDANGKLKSPWRAALDGAREVMVPVSLAVITTGIAFSPMLSIPGTMGDFTSAIAIVVIVAIFFSLVESLFILPAHLGHEDNPHRHGGIRAWIHRSVYPLFHPFVAGFLKVQEALSNTLARIVDRVYRPHLDWAIKHRYVVLAIGLSFLIVTVGLFAGGRIRFSFFPPIEGYHVIAALTMPEGYSKQQTLRAVDVLSGGAENVRRDLEGDQRGSVVRHIRTSVGEQPGTVRQGPPNVQGPSPSRTNLAEVHIELVPAEERTITAEEVTRLWREQIGNKIPNAVELTFAFNQVHSGDPVNVELAAPEVDLLIAAADELKEELKTIRGVYDIADDFRKGKPELQIEVTPSGTALGLTQADVARQVRQAFYGDEAQRVQVGRDNLRVFVRYPEDERRSLGQLESMRIRLPGGGEAPFSEVAQTLTSRGPASINRIDNRRAIVVTTEVDRSIADAGLINQRLNDSFLPELCARYPGLSFALGGEQRRRQESMSSLLVGMALSFFMLFGLLAVAFRSYLQPLIVLSAIPFGFAGAIWAHMLLGMPLTFLSMIGLLALMGVVVNDSLVMIDFINRYRRDHNLPLLDAVREAGPRRFRPILLTSLTTFAGLTPIILETSVQAAFVIPMAVSLAFGVAFATIIILLLVPAGYIALEDLRRILLGARDTEEEPVTAEQPESEVGGEPVGAAGS